MDSQAERENRVTLCLLSLLLVTANSLFLHEKCLFTCCSQSYKLAPFLPLFCFFFCHTLRKKTIKDKTVVYGHIQGYQEIILGEERKGGEEGCGGEKGKRYFVRICEIDGGGDVEGERRQGGEEGEWVRKDGDRVWRKACMWVEWRDDCKMNME